MNEIDIKRIFGEKNPIRNLIIISKNCKKYNKSGSGDLMFYLNKDKETNLKQKFGVVKFRPIDSVQFKQMLITF